MIFLIENKEGFTNFVTKKETLEILSVRFSKFLKERCGSSQNMSFKRKWVYKIKTSRKASVPANQSRKWISQNFGRLPFESLTTSSICKDNVVL